MNEKKIGQNKCSKCGSTDISFNEKQGCLTCNFCHAEIVDLVTHSINDDIKHLKGDKISDGLANLDLENDSISLKCESCGAEIVVKIFDSESIRCHWCRNFISINQQIPSGSIPDAILPFHVAKLDAKNIIDKFVKKRKFFMNSKFKKEFCVDNMFGVYLPYMTVDVNAKAKFKGFGEVLLRKYTVSNGSGKNRRYKKRYDVDLYKVEREFDIFINDLTIESKSNNLDMKSESRTTNIINAVLPFDIENCVDFDANYLRGFSSEKRNVDVDDIKEIVEIQSSDIARWNANSLIKKYKNRGVRWEDENLEVVGQSWHAVYLPIWLYSYYESKKSRMHYVAVNGRTMEVMGSIPIHKPKLIAVSILIEFIGIVLAILTQNDRSIANWAFLLLGIIFYLVIHKRYSNFDARHYHESDTKSELNNISEFDEHVKTIFGVSNSKMRGANNNLVRGNYSKSILDKFDVKKFIDYI